MGVAHVFQLYDSSKATKIGPLYNLLVHSASVRVGSPSGRWAYSATARVPLPNYSLHTYVSGSPIKTIFIAN